MIDIVREIEAVQREVGEGPVPAGAGRSIRLRRDYDAPIEDVWDALTNPERIGRWFLPISGDYRLGGRYQFEGNAGGEIVVCEQPHRLKVTWEYGAAAGEADASVLELRLSTADGGVTRLELEHTAVVPDEMWDRVRAGRRRRRLGAGDAWARAPPPRGVRGRSDRLAAVGRGTRVRDAGAARRGATRTWPPAPIQRRSHEASRTRPCSTRPIRRRRRRTIATRTMSAGGD